MANFKAFDVEDLDEMLGEVWRAEIMGECIKWIADLQIYQGSKECVDVYNGDDACGGWYVATIIQTLSEKLIKEAEKAMERLK